MNERERRRAHFENGGTIANYDRSHYTEEEKRILEERRIKNETKNH